MLQKIRNYKETLLIGVALAIVLFAVQFFEYKFIITSYRIQFYIGFIALLFTGLGIWIAQKLTVPKSETIFITTDIPIEKNNLLLLNYEEINRLKISKRELEVINLIAQGLSNQEIADTLFVSLNTIKTHSSNIFEKLDVKRRTQAVEKAKQLQIIL